MEQKSELKNRVIQTYAEDMAEVLQDDKSGLVKKIIHGEEQHEKERKNLSPKSKKNKFLMITGFIFILLGLTMFSFFFNRESPTVSVEKQFDPIVFNDGFTSIEVAGLIKDKITQNVFKAVSETDVKQGGLEGIYLFNNKKPVWLREFLQLIKGNLVLDNNDFVDDNFLLGVVNNETKDFFIVLKTRSLPDIFDSLRAWENKMFLDLHGFFGYEISPETSYLLTANFEDGVVENKNARILYDKDRKIVMMYVFTNNTSVIIANTKEAVAEIMLRFAASRIKQ
jgi:hypothetical protein